MRALRRTVPALKPFRLAVFFMLVTTIVPVAMELIVPRALRYVIDQGIEAGNMRAIWQGAGVMLATALLGTVATLGQGYCRAHISQGLAFNLRNTLFAHVQAFSFANLDRMQTGQLMTRLSSDVDMLRMFFSAGIALLLRALLMIVGSTVLMLFIDWRLTLVMAALLPLAGIVIWVIIRLAQPLFVVVQQKLGALNTIVQENLAGVAVVKAFVRERYEIGRFDDHNADYMAQHIRVGRLMAVALPALTILTNLGIVAVVWFGGREAIGDRLSLGNLIAFNNYLLIGMAPLLLLGNIITLVTRADASAERVWEILDTAPIVTPTADPIVDRPVTGAVAFDNVAFHYDGPDRAAAPAANGRSPALSGGRPVLHDITFTAAPGQRIALLGATGSGKSSLVNLIPRFYDPTAGTVRVDGVDVRAWEPEALRRHVGVVLQQSTLFTGTVRDNIAFGRPDAPLADVIAAARAAQAHGFIAALPDGYDTLVEERGANFSGGQKQRIAIARALLLKPAILILDDATSAVDLETEAAIQAALDALVGRCTTFIVAQRINSVLSADQILILDRGRIVAGGTHGDLLHNSPVYREIVASQLGPEVLP